MTTLRHYPDASNPKRFEEHGDVAAIAKVLAPVGVTYERWTADGDVTSGDAPEKVIAAYAKEIDRLKASGGYTTVDVISMGPDHPQKTELRKKFLDEHTHAEDEVRFFVDGGGLFTIHAGGAVYGLYAQKGDLVRVPAGTKHWFDMGPVPRFTAIRLFIDPAGWVADYTGDGIAARYPNYGEGPDDDEDVPTAIGAPPRQPRS